MKIDYITNNIYSNKGMAFETLINSSNEYYRKQNIAIIYKKPTPVQVVKVDYKDRTKAKIIEAYYKIPSTTDYNGIYKGYYVDFEAKETSSNRFSLEKVYNHQLDHLKSVKKLGAISFIMINYKIYHTIVMIDINNFLNFFKENNKKSITYIEALKIGIEVKEKLLPRIDYIKAIDEYIKKEELN